MTIHGLAKASVLLLALTLTACNTTTLQNVNSASYGVASTAQQLSLSQYETAIIRAGAERGWVFRRVGPGHLEGTIDVRNKHSATVDIFFDTQEFSIVYKDSDNLKYDAAARTIHRNYNSWVSNLERDIRREVQLERVA